MNLVIYLGSVETYGELMVMLPNESLESHFKAIRYYFDMNIDFLNINPLIFMPHVNRVTTMEIPEKHWMHSSNSIAE